ncbi:heat-inducible transcriptional repressor HrcA [Gloeobacter morelensis MG652769]|uniref:Heat-inducible transcription repressor HrcA n=1 Tax=Gloeobacter morelensis MG652769 TaxID=2781736 RepID=A0ABY3PT46_9CYAN|nr:heat-inducible transcriptional repressor HrcA [Gloeobacter morelensis MG652769]
MYHSAAEAGPAARGRAPVRILVLIPEARQAVVVSSFSFESSARLPLNPRFKQILHATVKSYIDTAEPVGSKMLTQQYNFGLSSATIRNAMAVLESWGLLFQPHTSAGRIPSDSGYRVYVDELISPPTELIQQMRAALAENLGERQDLESLLQGATRLLATLSGCVALITAPQSVFVSVRHLQIVHIGEGRALVIVVTDALQTRSFLLDLPQPEMAEQLETLNNFLNLQLQNRRVDDLNAAAVEAMGGEFHWYTDFLRGLIALLQRVLQPPTGQLYVSGVGEILKQPEFSEPERIQAIVQLLEVERERLGPLISPTQRHSRQIVVRIGAENPLGPMQFCSLVSSTYYLNEVPVGSVGVLGPTRLPYDRAIASVQAASDHLCQVMQAEDEPHRW